MIARDTTGKIIGHTVGGKFVPLIPVPTGEAFDDLLDESCLMIENFFRLNNRLHTDLRQSQGQHSTVLLNGMRKWGFPAGRDYKCGSTKHGGVRSWIEKGTLRSTDELSPVLNDFVNKRSKLQRMHKIDKDWELDSDGLKELSVSFGLPAPPPPEAIRAELDEEEKAEQGRARMREEDDRSRQAELEAKQKEFDASPEGQLQKKAEVITEEIVGPLEVIMGSSGDYDSAKRVAQQLQAEDRGRIRPAIDAIVHEAPWRSEIIVRKWRNAVHEYMDIFRDLEDLGMETQIKASEEEYCYLTLRDQMVFMTPTEIPELPEGSTRMTFASIKEVHADMDSNPNWEDIGIECVIRLSPERKYVIDFRPVAEAAA
jgi:hypothetical protein